MISVKLAMAKSFSSLHYTDLRSTLLKNDNHILKGDRLSFVLLILQPNIKVLKIKYQL